MFYQQSGSINYNNMFIYKKSCKSKIKIPYEKRNYFFMKYINLFNKKFKKIEEDVDDQDDIIDIKLNPGWLKTDGNKK